MELWLDAREASEDDLSEWESFQESADAVLLDEDNGGLGSSTKRRLIVKGDGKLVDGQGAVLGASLAVTDPKSQSIALSLVGSVDWIQVTCSDWTMIPAENLVSAAGGSPTRIAVELSEPSQVQGAAFALQIGVDALLLRPDTDLWAAAVSARKQRDDPKRLSESSSAESSRLGDDGGDGIGGGESAGGKVALSVGRVTRTKEGGIGDRVCVDLIQNLKAGEGMLVGSSAKMLALVHAETFETGFVPARPFRVNAGPVHSYALLADGSTKYLSELCAGDKVLVTNWKGESRKVAIGRLKVETRPMIMVEFQGQSGSIGQLFLQQAETVRLICPGRYSTAVDGVDYEGLSEPEGGFQEVGAAEAWHPLPVTHVEGGESVFLREMSRGTHVGQVIDAIVTET
eukprot:g17395.t1